MHPFFGALTGEGFPVDPADPVALRCVRRLVCRNGLGLDRLRLRLLGA